MGRKKSSKSAMRSRNSLVVSTISWVRPTMLCVVAVSSFITPYMCSITAIVLSSSSACSSMFAMVSFMNLAVCSVPEFCMAIWNGIELCSIGAPAAG